MNTGELVVMPAEGRSDYVRERLQSLNKQAGEMILENGLLLKEMKDNGYHKEWGYVSFESCIEAMQDKGEIDYGVRQSRNFIAIVDMVTDLGLEAGDLKDVSVSKLREIATLPGGKEARRAMLEAASEMSVSDVQKAAKKARDDASGKRGDPLSPVTLMMTESMKEFYSHCMTQARELHAVEPTTPDVVVLVDVVLADWLGSALGNADVSANADVQ